MVEQIISADYERFEVRSNGRDIIDLIVNHNNPYEIIDTGFTVGRPYSESKEKGEKRLDLSFNHSQTGFLIPLIAIYTNGGEHSVYIGRNHPGLIDDVKKFLERLITNVQISGEDDF
jgi:hypothetical protein